MNKPNHLIGKIKWYGGFNSKTGKNNEFGFISTRENNEDYFFHLKDIASKSSEFKENDEVIFIAQQSKKGEKATKVQLFSETSYATIIKSLQNSLTLFEFNPKYVSSEIYNAFNHEDKKLASIWTKSWLQKNKNAVESYTMAKMLSARGAEKVVINFYRKLGYTVEDISIKQLAESNDDWISYDISLNDERKIDVKNARTSINNTSSYSEFYIPQHKKDRYSQDISISGILSAAASYRGGILQTYRYGSDSIIYLGEICNTEIQYLKEKYEKNGLLELTLSRNGDDKFIAPWMFDYPEIFYEKINKLRCQINKFENEDLLIIEKYTELNNINLIPEFITVGIELNHKIVDNFDHWTRDFYNTLLDEDIKKLTLPRLFLLVLSEFLNQVKQNPPHEYDPLKYKNILFSLSSCHPLGVYDPLDIISNLIENLNTLWFHNKKLDYSLFKGFKINGKGLFSGKHSNGQTYTLLAYCGGTIEKKGKCGYSPLIMTKNENCNICGKLICPHEECDFCSENCSRYVEKKQLRLSYENER